MSTKWGKEKSADTSATRTIFKKLCSVLHISRNIIANFLALIYH